jgi:hypothetical protein
MAAVTKNVRDDVDDPHTSDIKDGHEVYELWKSYRVIYWGSRTKITVTYFFPGFHLQIPAKAHGPMASNGFFSEIRHDFSARGSTSTTTAPMERVQAVVPLEWSIGTLVSDQDSKGKGCKDD